jgi:hypothetical protein
MEVHHMLERNGNNFQWYQKIVFELGSILQQLANYTQVIWLNQYPIVDFYGEINSENTEIHSEKVNIYNKAVKHILK